eukprot:GHVL01022012.1.p3 GENE.GHVL01022012.1~~GHVL01022012.1.p3  ORF type:complete len:437 (-),score=69.19 GHVL01022012.1:5698-7008(-)
MTNDINKEEYLMILCRQLEFYFSDENLNKDRYLQKLINPHGWVLLSELKKFNRIKELNPSKDDLANAIIKSKILALDKETFSVKRNSSFKPSDDKSEHRTVYVENIPFSAKLEDIASRVGVFGQVKVLKFPKRQDGLLCGHGWIEFETQAEADAAVMGLKKHISTLWPRLTVMPKTLWNTMKKEVKYVSRGIQGGSLNIVAKEESTKTAFDLDKINGCLCRVEMVDPSCLISAVRVWVEHYALPCFVEFCQSSISTSRAVIVRFPNESECQYFIKNISGVNCLRLGANMPKVHLLNQYETLEYCNTRIIPHREEDRSRKRARSEERCDDYKRFKNERIESCPPENNFDQYRSDKRDSCEYINDHINEDNRTMEDKEKNEEIEKNIPEVHRRENNSKNDEKNIPEENKRESKNKVPTRIRSQEALLRRRNKRMAHIK